MKFTRTITITITKIERNIIRANVLPRRTSRSCDVPIAAVSPEAEHASPTPGDATAAGEWKTRARAAGLQSQVSRRRTSGMAVVRE
jgi:hypothetical protein